MFDAFFKDHIDEFCKVSGMSEIVFIIQNDEYYFNKALTNYAEFNDIYVKKSTLDNLIDYDFASELVFKYIENPLEYKILKVIGKLVFHFRRPNDDSTRFKDEGLIHSASSGIESSMIMKSLLKFKKNKNITELNMNCINLIRYFEQPSKIIPNFFYEDKEKIFKYISNEKDQIFKCMNKIGIQAKNPMNNGYLYSKILGSKQICKLWDATHYKIWAFNLSRAFVGIDYKNEGIIGTMWEWLYLRNNLKWFHTKGDLIDSLRITYGTESNYVKNGLALWQFCNEIQIGDKIVAKVDNKVWFGDVISDYFYNFHRDYKHVRYVNWNQKGITLSDFTASKDICQSIEKVIEEGTVNLFDEVYEPYFQEVGSDLDDLMITEIAVTDKDGLNNEADIEYSEGRKYHISHLIRERNYKVIKQAKIQFMKKHGKLFCEVCNINFSKVYGNRGNNFIEGHHRKLVSEMNEGDKTKAEDIAILCSNCHRMIHRKPIITVEELAKIFKEQRNK